MASVPKRNGEVNEGRFRGLEFLKMGRTDNSVKLRRKG